MFMNIYRPACWSTTRWIFMMKNVLLCFAGMAMGPSARNRSWAMIHRRNYAPIVMPTITTMANRWPKRVMSPMPSTGSVPGNAIEKEVRPQRLLLNYPVRLALNPFVSGIGALFPQLISGGAIVGIHVHGLAVVAKRQSLSSLKTGDQPFPLIPDRDWTLIDRNE